MNNQRRRFLKERKKDGANKSRQNQIKGGLEKMNEKGNKWTGHCRQTVRQLLTMIQ